MSARLSQESFDGLLDLIYHTAVAPAGWDQLLVRLADEMGCIAGGLTVESPGTGRGAPITYFGFDPDHVAKTFDHFLPMNPLHGIHDRMRTGHVITNAMAVPLDAFQRSEFYHGWARPQGLCCPVTVVLTHDHAAYMPLTLVRPDGHGDLPATELRFLDRLAPHLARAARMGKDLRDHHVQGEVLASALSHLGAAVFILDRQRRVSFASAPAERMLATGSAIRTDRQRRLTATVRASDAGLQSALRGAISGVAQGADVQLLARNGSKLAVTVLAVARVSAPDLAVTGDAACFVIIREPGAVDAGAAARQAARLFGLTPAEERVLAALLPGAGLPGAAAALGIGRETARSHLRSIFSKTGTSRQAELIAMTVTLTPPAE
ncbi:MAG: hypothetical protein Q4G25_06490 [Paracoccus sp. (in: a-proteobacteria)]|nr:hypothetical protein [Paracoccus sp. (in: a-proteobacteria)]